MIQKNGYQQIKKKITINSQFKKNGCINKNEAYENLKVANGFAPKN